jgi:acetoin utilization deacetylase AcuC-like enzyme
MSRVLVARLGGEDRHDTGNGHPERAARLDAVAAGLQDAMAAVELVDLAPRAATIDELARVHDRAHLLALERTLAVGRVDLDPDTPAGPGSWETALLATGAGLAAIDAVERGEAGTAFVAVRPPGHHAGIARSGGFCLVNNVAVGAAALRDRGERVLVVDWDVHHGNGTQEIFWDDPDVLYASTHEWPAYPGTGWSTEVGGPHARGATVNVPLPPGSAGDAAITAFDLVIAPVVEAFAPTWVLLSAGFDAHRDDPLAGLGWSAGDFALLAARVRRWAPRGRVVAYLEGGYDLEALRRSVSSTVTALAGDAVPAEPPSAPAEGAEWAYAAARLRRRELEEASWG